MRLAFVTVCLTILITRAAAETPTERVRRIDNAIEAAKRRAYPLPATAAEGARIADELDALSASAKAALTSDLRVVAVYNDVLTDANNLPALANALRRAYPCRDGIRSGRDAIARGESVDYEKVRASCAAYDKEKAGTKLSMLSFTHAEGELAALVNAAMKKKASDAAKARAAEQRTAEQASTVVRRLGMTAEDAADPAKVAEAFAKLPDFVMHAPKDDAGAPVQDTCRAADGTAKDLRVWWSHNGEASGLEIEGPYTDAYATMPLLVWQRDGYKALVVTADGQRYHTDDVTKLEAGPPTTPWAKHATNTCLDEKMIQALRKDLDAALLAKVERASDAAGKCVQTVWRSGEREFAANDTANITASTRDNRYSALLDKYSKAVERKCAPNLNAYQSALRALATSYAKPREATLEAVNAAIAPK